jgi:hypothetical protein
MRRCFIPPLLRAAPHHYGVDVSARISCPMMHHCRRAVHSQVLIEEARKLGSSLVTFSGARRGYANCKTKGIAE